MNNFSTSEAPYIDENQILLDWRIVNDILVPAMNNSGDYHIFSNDRVSFLYEIFCEI